MKIDGKMIFPEIKTKLLYPQCFSPPEERREVELPVLSLKTSSIPDIQTKKFLLPLNHNLWYCVQESKPKIVIF